MSLHLSCAARCRVLEVDDNPDVADSQGLLLGCLGADTRVAYDGETAIGIIPAFKPHLVIMDVGMPGMDGCETARRIRQLPEGKNLILAALSGWGDDDIRRQTAEAGFDHHFVKPMRLEALERLLASCTQSVG
jgi:CheY-like chemotaxis protein